ncbi:hypothetical protein HCN44_011391 [Aphidius gifuensis]|uniref:Uncharacterized protein n=2 Tax=Aphidius gifuensis TaxID=684658 RepID=A0A834XWY9_APHGI|nr:hypothetical protein HCN44_011391 [Aphidius gifuensis]
MQKNNNKYDIDMSNITVMGTPRPRACSTVERKDFRNPYDGEAYQQYRDLPVDQSDLSDAHDDSSLGILDNLSTRSGFLGSDVDNLFDQLSNSDKKKIEMNRQLARELIEKVCVDNTSLSFSHDTDKENNVNSQNMSNFYSPSTLIDSSPFDRDYSNSDNQKTLTKLSNISMNSVRFEPNEITARSSEMSPSPSRKNDNNNFSFNSTAAELMAKFSKDDFLSGSRLNSQLDADQQSYIQNYNPIPLTPTAENNRMEFSCFSGVMGDLDLTVESTIGRKLSVGEFFKRKCDSVGNLPMDRLNFGQKITSPERPTRNEPLANLTTTTNASETSCIDKINKSFASTIDCSTREQTQDVISLSKIAEALENTDGTPRCLVDYLLDLKKSQKSMTNNNQNQSQNQQQQQPANCTTATYTVMSKRSSLPSMLLDNSQKSTGKLSLDSKKSNTLTNSKIEEKPSRVSFDNTIDVSEIDEELLKNIKKSDSMKKYEQLSRKNSILHNNNSNNNKLDTLVNIKSSPLSTPINTYGKLTKNEIESPAMNTVKYETNRSFDKLIIGRNEQGIYRCIVGVSKDLDIEMLNESDRWLVCSCNVVSIQGDQDNVKLETPKYTILIEPSKCQIAKVTVKLLKIGKPIMASLSIIVKDMTTHEIFTKNHMMCFIPEDPKIEIIEPAVDELDFNTSKIYPIKLANKFDSNVPIEFFIINDSRRQFTINISNDLIVNTYSNDQETFYVVTMTKNEELIVDVQLNHRLSSNTSRVQPTLIIRVHNDLQNGMIIKKYLLKVDDITSTKQEIELINTQIPMLLTKKNGKYLKIKNTTNQQQTLTSSVQITKNSDKLNLNFTIEPKKIVVDSGESVNFLILYKGLTDSSIEKTGMIRIKTDKYSYWYTVIGDNNDTSIIEQSNDNTQRCDTPPQHQQHQQLMLISLPSSPKSTTSDNKYSPRSSVSGQTIAGDSIPIQSTHSTLSWISIKIGKYEIKEFTIRNTSQNRIKLQATITDNDKCFKFLKDRESSTSITFSLLKMESKTLTIKFSPNNIGACAGKITFRHYEQKNNDVLQIKEQIVRPSRLINLYGYGGYAKVTISQALKLMGDQMWLSLGKLNNNGKLKTRIKLENSGDLSAYVKINLSPKAVYPGMETSWMVQPTELILASKQSQWITIDFYPKNDDLLLLKGDVSDMGILTITHGDEPTRWRIRRLYKKLIDSGQITKKNDDVFRDIVRPICKVLPGELQMHNLTIIRDATCDLGVLCRGVNRHLITLFMELNTDDTITMFDHDNGNETQTFQSLCSDTSTLFPTTEDSYMPLETINDSTTFNNYHNNEFILTPSILTIDQSTAKDSTFIIKSLSSTAQPFEIKLSQNDLLSVIPIGGMIPAKRDVVIKLKCKKIVDVNTDVIIHVFTSNQQKSLDVKILPCSRR